MEGKTCLNMRLCTLLAYGYKSQARGKTHTLHRFLEPITTETNTLY